MAIWIMVVWNGFSFFLFKAPGSLLDGKKMSLRNLLESLAVAMITPGRR